MDSPDSQAFLASVRSGCVGAGPCVLVSRRREIPEELRTRGAAQVPVRLVDKHDQPYAPPKKIIKAFSGAGHKLGKHVGARPDASDAAQRVGGHRGVARAGAGSSRCGRDGSGGREPAAHQAADPPRRRLAVRGAGAMTALTRRRLVGKFNNDQPVAAVRRFIDACGLCARRFGRHTCRSRGPAAPYVLLTTFPNKEIRDEAQTLELAGLLGATVVQKHK